MQRTSNVTEFAILKDDELLSPRDFHQASGCPVCEVLDDVCMCLEYAYLVAHILSQLQELRRGRDIRGHAQVGPFELDESQKVGGQGCEARLLRALVVALEETGVAC